jgi:dipeptidyl-peptidase-4
MKQRHAARISLLMVVVAALAAAPAMRSQSRARQALTVERIWAAGQPSLSGALTQGLQWSPDGKLLTYFQRSGQGREARTDIWALEVASGQRRVLVEMAKLESLVAPAAEQRGVAAVATGLARVAPQRYQWSPRGDALLLTVQGNLVWYDLKSQSAKRLTSFQTPPRDAKISPDQRWVSYVREHNVWAVEISSGKERALTTGGREELLRGELDWVYPEELSIRTAYWWSPDSTKIAFLEMDQRSVTRYPIVNFTSFTGETEWMRYPKAGDANPVVRVGVVALKGGAPKWMDTGAEKDIYLARVDWLPDSRRLAIQRMNRGQTQLDLLLADAATGRTQVLLTELDNHWINIQDDLYFFRDGKRFLWSSDRDGWRHLYLYDLSGVRLAQITRGHWEVLSTVRVDETNNAVYFLATEKTPLEAHLYRAPLDGSTVTRITRADGSHGVNMAPDAAHFVDTWSTAMTPPRQDLVRADGSLVLAINENKVPQLAEYKFSPVEFFTVRGADGTELHAMMIKPPDFDAKKRYPVLVYTYGGPHAQIVRNAWGGANFLWHQLMAQKGYLIFGLDNRGSSGRGKAFETAIYRNFGKHELADQLAGVAWLKSQPYVDGARIGIWGWSYGGYMTCFAMLNAADTFKAGFAGAPVTNWRQYDTIYTERYMGRPQDNPDGYRDSSPVHQAAKLKGKLLIAHGTADDNVHYANTIELMELFIRAGKYAEVLSYPGRGHGIGDPVARVHLFNRVTQFFLDNL